MKLFSLILLATGIVLASCGSKTSQNIPCGEIPDGGIEYRQGYSAATFPEGGDKERYEIKQFRTCVHGEFTAWQGPAQFYEACTEDHELKPCQPGQTEMATYYKKPRVPFGQNCESVAGTITRNCIARAKNDYVFESWAVAAQRTEYQYANCVTADPAPCTGGIQHNQTVTKTYYTKDHSEPGSPCDPHKTKATCYNGELSYNPPLPETYYNYCDKGEGHQECTYNGKTFAHNEVVNSRIRYKTAVGDTTNPCISEQQNLYCQNGKISEYTGTYTHQICANIQSDSKIIEIPPTARYSSFPRSDNPALMACGGVVFVVEEDFHNTKYGVLNTQELYYFTPSDGNRENFKRLSKADLNNPGDLPDEIFATDENMINKAFNRMQCLADRYLVFSLSYFRQPIVYDKTYNYYKGELAETILAFDTDLVNNQKKKKVLVARTHQEDPLNLADYARPKNQYVGISPYYFPSVSASVIQAFENNNILYGPGITPIDSPTFTYGRTNLFFHLATFRIVNSFEEYRPFFISAMLVIDEKKHELHVYPSDDMEYSAWDQYLQRHGTADRLERKDYKWLTNGYDPISGNFINLSMNTANKYLSSDNVDQYYVLERCYYDEKDNRGHCKLMDHHITIPEKYFGKPTKNAEGKYHFGNFYKARFITFNGVLNLLLFPHAQESSGYTNYIDAEGPFHVGILYIDYNAFKPTNPQESAKRVFRERKSEEFEDANSNLPYTKGLAEHVARLIPTSIYYSDYFMNFNQNRIIYTTPSIVLSYSLTDPPDFSAKLSYPAQKSPIITTFAANGLEGAYSENKEIFVTASRDNHPDIVIVRPGTNGSTAYPQNISGLESYKNPFTFISRAVIAGNYVYAIAYVDAKNDNGSTASSVLLKTPIKL